MKCGRLMLDVAGTKLTEAERLTLKHSQVGGLILFSRNYQDRQQLSSLISDIRQQNPDIIIAVDQEGGRVQRFRDGFVTLPSMSKLSESYQRSSSMALSQAKEIGWLMAAELISVGIDISLAPVLDLDWSHSSVIGTRAFGSEPEQVIALTTAFVQGMNEAGMASTGKHFPGHGWAKADSHLEVAVDDRPYDVIFQHDVKPFAGLIAAGLDAVMPAHVIYSAVDDKPAGFSSLWLQQVLRRDLAFEGVIFSDDLNMNGARVSDCFSDRAAAAISAGCDMILVCNNPDGAKEVLDYLEANQIEKSSRLSRMRRTVVPSDVSRRAAASQIAVDLADLN